MANATDLDPDIAALCDAMLIVQMSAMAMRQTFVQGMQAFMALRCRPQRLYTGYMPEAQRRANVHHMLSNGLRTRAPKDPNIEIKAAARKMGYAC